MCSACSGTGRNLNRKDNPCVLASRGMAVRPAHPWRTVLMPELDAAGDAPAFMAVFDGSLEIPYVGPTGFAPRTYSGAVCVLVDGAPNIHPEPDVTGLTP